MILSFGSSMAYLQWRVWSGDLFPVAVQASARLARASSVIPANRDA
jgi:hypothetical protein